MIGKTLDDRYRILSLIGQGSMSIVYKAEHMMMRRIVAIKVLKSELIADQESIKRFQQEATAICTLSHPNVVAVYDFGISPEGTLYLAMDFVEGESLATLLATEVRLEPGRALPIFREACSALWHAHQKGIIHRDIKPSNIIVTKSGQGGADSIKLVDFGIAKLLDRQGGGGLRLTQSGDVFGSPLYMSPEQCMGRAVDGRSDIYSLGCVMYETLTGKKPFEASTPVEIATKHLSEIPEPFRSLSSSLNIPEKLESIVFKAIDKDPLNRYQSMAELIEALEKYQTGSQKHKPASVPHKGRVTKMPVMLIAALAAVVLLAVALAGAQVLQSNDSARTMMMELELALKDLVLQRSDPALLAKTEQLSDLYSKQGRYQEAQNRLKNILTVLEGSSDIAGVARLLTVYSKLINTYRGLGDQAAARKTVDKFQNLVLKQMNQPAVKSEPMKKVALLTQQMNVEEKVFGPNSVPVARTACKIGTHYLDINDLVPAEQYLRKSESILDQPDSRKLDELHWTLASLSRLYLNRGDYKLAEKSAREVISQRERQFGPNASYSVDGIRYLSSIYQLQHKYPQAISAMKEALRRDDAAGRNQPEVLVHNERLLASLYLESGNVDQAERLLLKALSELKDVTDSWLRFTIFNSLAATYQLKANHERALTFYDKALPELEQFAGRDSLHYTRIEWSIANYCRMLGKLKKSDQLFRHVISFRRSHGQEAPDELARSLFDLASLRAAEGNQPAADRCFSESASLLLKVTKSDHPLVIPMLFTLADHFIRKNDRAQAEDLYRKAIAISDFPNHVNQNDRVDARTVYSQFLRAIHRDGEAGRLEQQVKELQSAVVKKETRD